jgi:hypothetical protein
MKNGFGKSFELFNVTWIFKYLSAQYPSIQLKHGLIFKDESHNVNKNSDTFEVDIFSHDPLVVAECTTFLNSEYKVHKLIRMKNYFYFNKNAVHVKLFFVAYEIHESIKESVVTFCLKNEKGYRFFHSMLEKPLKKFKTSRVCVYVF